MIKLIIIPTAEQLQPLIEEALTNTTEAEFIQAHVNGITELLKQSPQSYRNYGAYWWSIKELLRVNDANYGDEDEPLTRKHFSYENPVHLLCAAWAYSNYIVDSGQTFTNIHNYPTEEDEPFEYGIEDLDMEEMTHTIART